MVPALVLSVDRGLNASQSGRSKTPTSAMPHYALPRNMPSPNSVRNRSRADNPFGSAPSAAQLSKSPPRRLSKSRPLSTTAEVEVPAAAPVRRGCCSALCCFRCLELLVLSFVAAVAITRLAVPDDTWQHFWQQMGFMPWVEQKVLPPSSPAPPSQPPAPPAPPIMPLASIILQDAQILLASTREGAGSILDSAQGVIASSLDTLGDQLDAATAQASIGFEVYINFIDFLAKLDVFFWQNVQESTLVLLVLLPFLLRLLWVPLERGLRLLLCCLFCCRPCCRRPNGTRPHGDVEAGRNYQQLEPSDTLLTMHKLASGECPARPWALALEQRELHWCTAPLLATGRLLLCHFLQPLGYFVVFVHYLPALGEAQRALGLAVLTREGLALLGAAFSASCQPAFLLLDPVVADSAAERHGVFGGLSGVLFHVLAPEKLVLLLVLRRTAVALRLMTALLLMLLDLAAVAALALAVVSANTPAPLMVGYAATTIALVLGVAPWPVILRP